MNIPRLIIIFSIVLAILSIPLIAMQFTSEVNWNIIDFAIMGALLLSMGITIDFVLRKVKSLKTKMVLSAVIVLIFLLICAELAVGIFGSPIPGS